jgi:uncharacterized protein YlxW (UPF0749 family)
MSKSKALALNNNETLKSLQKEVMDEFITSDREVYKEALRSLLAQEQRLNQQRIDLNKELDEEMAQVAEAKKLLDASFKDGTLHSVQDARGIVRTVGRNSANQRIEKMFD